MIIIADLRHMKIQNQRADLLYKVRKNNSNVQIYFMNIKGFNFLCLTNVLVWGFKI